MTMVGQLSLLAAFAGSGYASFACIKGAWDDRAVLRRAGQWAGWISVLALSVGLLVLGHALCTKDFRFAYVTQYSSQLLPWHYSLSALWVGQAGSLLLWAWMLGVLALIFRRGTSPRGAATGRGESGPSAVGDRDRESAFGVLMGYLCFLTATMVFAADPMEPSLARASDGQGLSPLLQHPAMLIHPPVVFLGYAAWAVPCALTLAALAGGNLDYEWLRHVRPWALLAWGVLGVGILLGAQWSYEELGWGGYWAWDPVENASLVPWLTGTAFLHASLAWRSRGVLKKTVVALAVATFGLCNFATFLTRSGIFSSLHAFSRSPIGWLFLGLMFVLAATAAVLIQARRSQLAPERPISSFLSCEAMVSLSALALGLLAFLVTAGTLFVALSEAIVGRRIMVGPEFYNNVLVATGLVVMLTMAPAPLLQWGSAPSRAQKSALAVSVALAAVGGGLAVAWGLRLPLALSLTCIILGASTALLGRVYLDVQRRLPGRFFIRFSSTMRAGRRAYAGFVAHLGLLCLAAGVTGSSLGTQRHELDIVEGETVKWADRSIQFARLSQTDEGDKFVVEAELVVSPDHGARYSLRPAQHLHKIQNTWTTEAAIHHNWGGDFYTILHHGEGSTAHFTFVINPMMRWIWLGGAVMGLSVLVGAWPDRFTPSGSRQAQAAARSGQGTPYAHHLAPNERPQRAVRGHG
jgi:cytochrome c-type biogenesis protein CcmF